ncbi:MAG: S-layer homology domain-containing protein [Oscillospiraceae bacterium]
MKLKKLVSAVLAFSTVFCLFSVAYASSWENYTDISGHWAEATIKKGFEDGLITGLGDSLIAPDAPITAAQMITVLCRVLGASDKADISVLDISSDVWYADAAGKALKLGLISAKTGSLDAPMTRQCALSIMAKAFCLIPAEPDYTVLGSFSDASGIATDNRGAIAALVSEKLIQGYAGTLNVNGSITRAEFLTILYRVAANYTTAGVLTSGMCGGSVLKGSGWLNYISAGNVWFDCSAQSVSLIGVKADIVTLRSSELTSFTLSGGSSLSGLVVAIGKGSPSVGDLDSQVGTLRIESCTGMNVGSGVNAIEVTGNGMSVNISGSHDSLIITGSGNTVTLSSGASVSALKVAGTQNIIKTAGGAVSFGKTDISGNENDIEATILAGYSLAVVGSLNKIFLSSNEDLDSIDLTGNSNWLSLSCTKLASASVSGNYNTVNKLSAGAVASLNIPGANNAFLLDKDNVMTLAEIKGESNAVTVNGTADTITVSGYKNKLDGAGNVAYLNINSSGCTISLNADCVTDNSNQAEIDRVQKLVTLGYAGNYTL